MEKREFLTPNIALYMHRHPTHDLSLSAVSSRNHAAYISETPD